VTDFNPKEVHRIFARRADTVSFSTPAALTSPRAENLGVRAFDRLWEFRYSAFMNDVTQDSWFFTREGERIGPVSLSDLRIKAKEGALNPRLDLVWTQGMAEWKPAGEIDGLFERRTATEPQEFLAPAADPYAPPQQESVAAQMGKEGNWPGVRRRSYLFAVILLPFLISFGMGLATPLMTSQFGDEITGWIMLGSLALPFIIGIYFGIQRLANVGMSRWWYLGHFVPLLNVWVGYRSFACPGGYAYHKKLDGIGILLAIIYWLCVAIIVLSIIAIVALFAGALGTPEIQQQIQEAIRQATAPKP
jgi:GYF domain 2